MKLMLTSFGVLKKDSDWEDDCSLFTHMPPHSYRRRPYHNMNALLTPDYETLLLCDQIIMDKHSFRRLTEHDLWGFLAEAFNALHSEGFITIVDYKAILRQNSNLLDRMVAHDLSILDNWVSPLVDSLRLWVDFAKDAWDLLEGDVKHYWAHVSEEELEKATASSPLFDTEGARSLALIRSVASPLSLDFRHAVSTSLLAEEALSSVRKRRKKEHRKALREVLSWYLSYVNANIILSNELGVGFHDWCDFQPFYKNKWLNVGKDTTGTTQAIEESRQLFSVAFPELAITDVSALMKALKDKRIESLRALVQDAVRGKVEFNNEFARRTLHEVLGEETRTGRWRRVVSYVTAPLGFVPWIGTAAQKLAEEVTGSVLENKLKNKHKWFYLLSDVSEWSFKSSDSPGTTFLEDAKRFNYYPFD